MSELLSPAERETIGIAQFAQSAGFGERPAVLVVDAQNYMVGDVRGATTEFPSGCGQRALDALQAAAPLLELARARSVPVIYTRFVLRPDGSDVGQYGRKRAFRNIRGWAIAGTPGAEISELVSPHPGDTVLDKNRPSAFFGTPLLPFLIERQIDSLLVVGGSTSNCVRATVVDAFSYNYRPVVVRDCVFDRFDISHRVTLFDLERQYADVKSAAEVAEHLACYDGADRARQPPPLSTGRLAGSHAQLEPIGTAG